MYKRQHFFLGGVSGLLVLPVSGITNSKLVLLIASRCYRWQTGITDCIWYYPSSGHASKLDLLVKISEHLEHF